MKNPTRQVRRQMLRNGGLRVPGFTPVGSKRLAKLVQRKTLVLARAMRGKSEDQLRMLGLPTNIGEVQEEAQRLAVRDLPVEPMVRSHKIKPSKSDMAAYRKSSGPDLVFA